MIVIGADLSGPSNITDTALVFCEEEKGSLHLRHFREGVSDLTLIETIQSALSHSSVLVGLDAPLSYQPGGGDRPGEKNLRKILREKGLPGQSIMTPTMTRMVYLTLRGVSLSRAILSLSLSPSDVKEVHPGSVFLLREAPTEPATGFKKHSSHRKALLQWMESYGFAGVTANGKPSDHYVAACGAALGAWEGFHHRYRWIEKAAPPIHPFDFCC